MLFNMLFTGWSAFWLSYSIQDEDVPMIVFWTVFLGLFGWLWYRQLRTMALKEKK